MGYIQDGYSSNYLDDRDTAVVANLMGAKETVCRAHLGVLEAIAAAGVQGTWERDGCRDLAHWLSLRMGTTQWVARRWINAAHTLPHLPKTKAALLDGRLSLEQVVELCRFATDDNEQELIRWATRVSLGALRAKADQATRVSHEETRAHHRERYLTYTWVDEGRRLLLEGLLPADQGAVVAKALDRAADRTPDVIADEEDEVCRRYTDSLDARRADALYQFCSRAIADDTDPDRATVVLHTVTDALCDANAHGSMFEGGGIVDPLSVMRMTCDCRIQVVREDREGTIVGYGRTQRVVSPALLRALKYRDGGCCTFPGCNARFFLHAHHIWHWGWGGVTELPNLVLVCAFHHKLLHEYGWRVKLVPRGTRWFRRDGTELEPMRAPPRQLALA